MGLNEWLVVVLVVSLVMELIVCWCCRRWFSFLTAVAIPFIVTASLLGGVPRLHDMAIIAFVYWFVPSTAACLALATVHALLKLGRPADRSIQQGDPAATRFTPAAGPERP